MNSKAILFVGFLASLLYVCLILFFQINLTKSIYKKSIKFLYLYSEGNTTIISQLPKGLEGSSFVKFINNRCNNFTCQKKISFVNAKENKKEIELFKKLINFSSDVNLTKASIIANGKRIELNFLLNNKVEFLRLKKIYKSENINFDIIDNSSLLRVINVLGIEQNINYILNKNSNIFKKINLDFSTKKVLKKIFRKVKVLGKTKVNLRLQSDGDVDLLKKYILKKYNWVNDINITKSNKNIIKIEGVE